MCVTVDVTTTNTHMHTCTWCDGSRPHEGSAAALGVKAGNMGRGGYGTVEFWDEYYVTDRPEPYDWFFSCAYLGELITGLLRPSDRILMVGCGNAPFSKELWDLGFQDLWNIDNCALVIDQQRERLPDMNWEVQDVRSVLPGIWVIAPIDAASRRGLVLPCAKTPERWPPTRHMCVPW